MIFSRSDTEISAPLHTVVAASYCGNNNGEAFAVQRDFLPRHFNGGGVVALALEAVGSDLIAAVHKHFFDIAVPVGIIKGIERRHRHVESKQSQLVTVFVSTAREPLIIIFIWIKKTFVKPVALICSGCRFLRPCRNRYCRNQNSDHKQSGNKLIPTLQVRSSPFRYYCVIRIPYTYLKIKTIFLFCKKFTFQNIFILYSPLLSIRTRSELFRIFSSVIIPEAFAFWLSR